ncbi:MAG: adenosylhomocysteinase [Candidatus Methylomirabilota bacterium]
MQYDVKDVGLAEKGRRRIEWARSAMPVLRLIEERFSRERPLQGIRVSACLTQDDVAASLVKNFGIPVFAIKGEDTDTYYRHVNAALDLKPNLTMDDGADTIGVIHSHRTDLAADVIAGTEETTTGVIRLKSMEKAGILKYPIIAVNDADTKHLFDNRYGTGQSTVDGILRATNLLLAGKRFVVCGYGWCGRGVAMRARGGGANVIVVETDPLKALEAVMDGYTVLPMLEAARVGEVFVTVTGNIHIIRKEHFEAMPDGAVVCNSGHFNVEIDIPALESLASEHSPIRDQVEEYRLKDGRRIYLLGEGRLINLVAAEGHPASVMDMSFANQALGSEYAVKNRGKLEKKVYRVPHAIDAEIARLKLESMGVKIDTLTDEQRKYLESWEMGT